MKEAPNQALVRGFFHFGQSSGGYAPAQARSLSCCSDSFHAAQARQKTSPMQSIRHHKKTLAFFWLRITAGAG